MKETISFDRNINTENTSSSEDKVFRLMKVMYIFLTKLHPTETAIMEELEISHRTLQRYRKTLYGIGVRTTASQGVIKLEDNYIDKIRADRLQLDFEESLSLMLADKLVENFTDKSVTEKFRFAMQKLRLVYKDNRMEEVLNQIQLTENKTSARRRNPFNVEQFPHNFLLDIQRAVRENKVVTIQDYVFHKQKRETRQILPLEVSFFRNTWHIFSFCCRAEDYREFRLDRVEKLTVEEETFSGEDFTIEAYHQSKKISTPEQRITVRFKKEVVQVAHAGKFNFNIKKESFTEDGLEVVFGIDRFKSEEFLRWIMSWGSKCEIVRPVSVKKEIRKMVADLVGHYGV